MGEVGEELLGEDKDPLDGPLNALLSLLGQMRTNVE